MTGVLLTDARVLTPEAVLEPGWVRVRGGRIEGVGFGDPAKEPGERGESVNRQWLLPGMIDLHVHGGGGASFSGDGSQDAIAAAAFHRRHGSTGIVASLYTAPLEDMARSAATLAELAEDGIVLGSHLEGPFLAPARCGAQDPRFVLAPDRAALERLLKAGRGTVRVVTLAPELPGASELIRVVLDAGAIVALGHTDATYEQASEAIDAGARLVTHLFNGMRPLHHREPGLALAALRRPEVTVELIADGWHVHPAMIGHVFRAAGAERVALITDSISATGMPEGSYRLGSLEVVVRSGVARLATGSSLAGSTLTVDRALRFVVEVAGLSVTDAVQSLAATPARLLGLSGRAGTIEPGALADLVVCSEGLSVSKVMAGGRWESS